MPPPGQEIHQAWAGEGLPVSARPAGAALPAYGDWGPFLGKAESYQLQYGPYLVLMNCSEDKTLDIKTPPDVTTAPDLVSGKALSLDGGSIKVKPMTTVVLWLGDSA
jgi:hypothetical protein